MPEAERDSGAVERQARLFEGTNPLAVTSLVFGILWLYGFGALLALILGVIALRQTKRRGQYGRGMAIAGIILGGLGLSVVLYAVVSSL